MAKTHQMRALAARVRAEYREMPGLSLTAALAALVKALDLRNAIHIGHCTGGGEVARCIGRHGTSRVAKAVLIVPIGASAMRSAKLVKSSTLKVYPGFSHGMCTVNRDQINTDLLAFIRA